MNEVEEAAEMNCPECGAPRVEGMDCWWQLGAILTWEWSDPELAAQHFLTVASYNLQHPAAFEEETLARLRETYIEHLDHGLPWGEIRRRMSSQFEGATRVLKPEGERRPVLRRWAMTIADVYLPDQPEGAAQPARVVILRFVPLTAPGCYGTRMLRHPDA
jgi:hypothetical protein